MTAPRIRLIDVGRHVQPHAATAPPTSSNLKISHQARNPEILGIECEKKPNVEYKQGKRMDDTSASAI